MRKFLALLFLSIASTASAQYAAANATVTATVTDSDGTAWTNGIWSLRFNPFNQASVFRLGGLPLDPAVLAQVGTMDGSGDLSISLYQNTTLSPSPSTTNWQLTLCPNATGKCGTYEFFLSASSTDLSGGITSAIVAPRFKAVAGTYGYTDTEASLNLTNGGEYVNVSAPCLKFYSGTWNCLGTSVPTNMIAFIASGTCPTGWTEVTALDGNYVLATTHAHGDVGTTGGSASYTPAGSSAAPTVASLTAAAQTFTGLSTTVPAETVNSLTAAAPTFTGASTTVPAETVNSLTAAAQTVNSLTAAAPTFNGDSTTVPAETVNSLTAAAQTVNSLTAAAQTISGAPAKGTLANASTTTSGNCASTNIAAGTGSTTACKATAPNLTVPAETISGAPTAGTLANASSAVTGTMNSSAVTGTLNSTTITPLGHNSTSAVTGTMNTSAVTGTLNSTTITPLGGNSTSAVTGTLNSTTITPLGGNAASAVTGTLTAGAFSGTPATITPLFYKMIPCSKN